jgi:hypothetical protein
MVASASRGAPASVSAAAFDEGLLGLQHFTTEENLIALLREGSLRPREAQASPRSVLGGSGDVSYFAPLGAHGHAPGTGQWVRKQWPGGQHSYELVRPDGTRVCRGAPDRRMVLTYWDCSLLDRADWFWNASHGSMGRPDPGRVTPGDVEAVRARCRAARAQDFKAGELCFSKPVSTAHCFRIYVQDEAQRLRVLAGLAGVPAPRGGSWGELILVADMFFDRRSLAPHEVPR